ncbi:MULTISPECIES: hypothetical protein [Allobacillus]|uniref:Uncharacterized protein n=1 Tax=Allobacillus salarius TaxID=1955272 RepID=A0A556PSY1_9BACI|nr:hypothetical protein [Allobacillus salarius]TSJ67493.1 hypothetical protein FPQ13_00025 [Allobacillus salarius]
MKKGIYRGSFFVIGVIVAAVLFLTDIPMEENTKLWLMVFYIVIGISVTEILRKKHIKRDSD